jgi:protein involved in temperature-dependent protein secretion
VWEQSESYDDQIPFGQKMWLADDDEIPLLELRSLEFNPSPVAV